MTSWASPTFTQASMGFTPSLDLSALYRKPVFQSRSPATSQRELTRAITPHDLRWGRGSVEAALFRHDLGGIALMALRYGAEVEIRPQAFRDFTLVQMPLRGHSHFESDGVSVPVAPGEVAVLSPQRSARLLWQRDCEQLIVKLPHRLLAGVLNHIQAAEDGGLTPRRVGDSLALPPAYKLPASLLPVWQGLVQQCLLVPPQAEADTVHPLWRRQFEQAMALFLLAHQPGVLPCTPEPGLPPALPRADAERLSRLERYLDSHLGSSLTLADLAAAAGVSPRLLNLLCQRHFGLAPMAWLRQRRLEAARELLQRQPERSVTDIALEFGFGHLGRFSAYYRQRYGELPSDTGPPAGHESRRCALADCG
ncbi:MAG: AraC family transcriptional regulator [Pigmentiphaga sp.]|nr:AraC family transcriptional regulator [Pigmentiphaga sp.]